MRSCRWLCVSFVLCLGASSLPATTLYFMASEEAGVMNYSWTSLGNWYLSDGMGGYVNAYELPAPTDTAYVLTDVNAAGNQINLAGLVLDGYEISVSGGNFIVGTAQIGATVVVASAYMEVSTQLTSSSCELNYDNITIQSGASWLLSTNTATGKHSAAEITGTTIYNVGQVVLTDGAEIWSLVGGTNESSILNRPNAVFSSSGMTMVMGPLLFDNGGTVRGDTGMLTFLNGLWTNSTTNLSQFKTTSADATISINGLSTIPASNTFAFSGPGLSVLVEGDQATINGTLQVGVVDSATGVIDPGTLECDAALTGTGIVHVVAGPGLVSTLNWGTTIISLSAVNVDASGVFNIKSAGDYSSLSGVVVNNSGTTTWTGGSDLEMDSGALFNNLAGALFDAQTNGTILSQDGTHPAINNAGTFRKSAGTGDLDFASSSTAPSFNNTGLLDVEAGRVVLAGGMNSAQFNVAGGAQVRFGTGTYTLASGASFTGSGAVALGGQSPLLVVNANVALGNFTFDDPSGTLDGSGAFAVNGAFNWSAGTIQGAGSVNMASGSMLSITGGTFHRAVNNAGMTTLSGGVTAGNGAAFNILAGGVCALQPGVSISYDGAGAWPLFNNAGILSNAPGSYITVGVPFSNSGSVQVQSNQMTFSQGYTQTLGSTAIARGATLELNSAGALIAGGTISGAGLVDGPLTNSATAHPGASPGILNFSYYLTAYRQTSAGALAIEIGGLTPGAQFSQLAASGPVALNGSLNLTLINGFQPALGNTFSVAVFPSRTGTFASVTGNHLAGGLVLVPVYSATNVALTVANEAQPTPPVPNGAGHDFTFNSTLNFNYAVEYADSLSPPIQWQTLTNIPGTGAPLAIIDHAAPPARFYRVAFQ
ncbi:MAG: hypothetical protein ABSC18_06435 [Verrucomicrobiota bacterium]